jgi:two-component system KDP operon response regulator KdpE
MPETQRKQRVLVVDDQPRVLKFIRIDLKLKGFEVLTASSGEEALRLLQSAKPDIMLLDLIMPEMDGCELLRRLRTFSEMPVIAFSASPVKSDEALLAGANDFMAKPFRVEQLVEKIEFLLDHKNPRQK